MSVATLSLPPRIDERRILFRPRPVPDFEDAGLNFAQVEGLILKFLLNVGVASGRQIAHELGLPFGPFPEFLRQLKNSQIVAYTNAATANDYQYALTDAGRVRAKSYLEECSYVGTAPVPFDDYVHAVAVQTISTEQPKAEDLRRAFADLLISEEMFDVLGPAINSGRGMFLYGYPGNGKTSIAERITRCFGTTVWIPRVL
ncbi:MAG TPA: AAA family ATPase, partial [Isosphaeraceae bacterium]|nr:AAA family ATPase [Isosphaeraceae bacterium]